MEMHPVTSSWQSPLLTDHHPPPSQCLWLSCQSHWPSCQTFTGNNLRALCADGVQSSILWDKVQWRWHHHKKNVREKGHWESLWRTNVIFGVNSDSESITQVCPQKSQLIGRSCIVCHGLHAAMCILCLLLLSFLLFYYNHYRHYFQHSQASRSVKRCDNCE